VLWLICGLIWKGDQITSVLIFLIGILPSFPFICSSMVFSAAGIRRRWKNCVMRLRFQGACAA